MKHAIRAPAPPGVPCSATAHASPGLNSPLGRALAALAPAASVVDPGQASYSGCAQAGSIDGCTGSSVPAAPARPGRIPTAALAHLRGPAALSPTPLGPGARREHPRRHDPCHHRPLLRLSLTRSEPALPPRRSYGVTGTYRACDAAPG
ncbi:hypothetical protein ACFC96_14650 [Streptomyces sp. NPDC055955]|uniref:hypothetical protein n=1 Tax=Streptomyces sp. NPDC055955 TaxID=3345665 RepID=UPI0035DE2C3B